MDIQSLGLKVPTDLRRCSWCGEAEKPSQKLKKCAACEYVMYCSKQCQKSAWSDHRGSCQYMSQGAKNMDPKSEAELHPFGFANFVAFSRAINDWMEAHMWALQTSAQVYILMLGGVKFLKIPPIYMTHFDVVCHTTPGLTPAERNPALAFSVRTQDVINIAEWIAFDPANADYWRGTDPEREQLAQLMEQRIGSAFACVMCALFKCERITMANTLNFPILHVRKRLPLDKASMDILEDVLVLCRGTINSGFPLRSLEGGDSAIPLPGRFARKAGRWTWEPLFADWDEYSPTSKEYEGLHVALGGDRKTQLSPKQLLSALLAL
ncbi:uncharacterized protein TRAVEDRAFT_71120 [Trametes versicolor FP-101664 SS1]|uniref:uncharacterized protein n=1 Tax=Trametes versicolor (strain FP-101664) TaxID=717944 RepID=UPI0004621977|nr:uncharacterized protein TRAVEDRAFT_71120 [Trametes versicolor FP-101664 SS1]EIW60864.1 hypothetical protein TRAVEDRAFT_71120 [Trametes versicolor FP-101664 SS1]